MKFLLAALALGIPAAAPVHAATAVVPDARSEAARLANLLVPSGQLLALLDPMFKTMLDAKLREEPRASAVFDRYPGMRDAVWDAIRPEMVRMIETALPQMRDEVAAMLLRKLQPADITGIADFLASPTGSKFYAAALRAAAENPNDQGATMAAVQKVLAERTPAELIEVSRFGSSGAADKLGLVSGDIAPIGERWGAKLVKDHGPRLETLIRKALADYMAGKE